MHMMRCLLKYMEIRNLNGDIFLDLHGILLSFVGRTTFGVGRTGMGRLRWFDVN
jgi:hypothetical protein